VARRRKDHQSIVKAIMDGFFDLSMSELSLPQALVASEWKFVWPLCLLVRLGL